MTPAERVARNADRAAYRRRARPPGRSRTRPAARRRGIEAALRATRRIAVVGASSDPARPSFGVFRYLVEQGYDCVPVNPNERAVLGVPAFRPSPRPSRRPVRSISSTSSDGPSCASRTPATPVAAGARCLWLQLGVVNWEAAAIAHDAGLGVVMDRCTAIEVRRIGGRDGRQGFRGGAPDQRMTKPRKTRTNPATAIRPADCACRRRISIATDAPVRPIVADSAAPGFVAGDVLVLGLEHPVARPGGPGPEVADRDQHDARQPQHDVQDAHRSAPLTASPAASRSRTVDWTSAAFACPVRRLHDLADQEPDRLRLAGPVVGHRRRVLGQHAIDGGAERVEVRDLAVATSGDDRCRRRSARGVLGENLASVRAGDRAVEDRPDDDGEL